MSFVTATETESAAVPQGSDNGQSANQLISEPVQYSSTLDQYESFNVTPVIADDAAVAQRGVVFFRNQDLTVEEQKLLRQKLGLLTGKPETSVLHRHAVNNSKRGVAVDQAGNRDDEISVISSEQNKKFYNGIFTVDSKKIASHGWHADGGDTLWASGYEAYDRLSPAWQRFAETLTATHAQPYFRKLLKKHYARPRSLIAT
ncbi:hypothetical protein G7Z17_g5923 [Cylindrodendrum hubeiense]|uniref:TauD/TfdA-like domain-containing protein n=1 Tax=Cylindrodendrum hubeiense TaxID=595255 RepID=A0A9P5H851_9HYPO|nr:hypothetical protein G7Z17_g5923 [Cylindrodendrum hubeiense]